jgi:hypothetical protein
LDAGIRPFFLHSPNSRPASLILLFAPSKIHSLVF